VNDAKDKGHWGTGDLEVIVRSEQDLELAKQLIQLSFEKN
jgi:predicted transport protein